MTIRMNKNWIALIALLVVVGAVILLASRETTSLSNANVAVTNINSSLPETTIAAPEETAPAQPANSNTALLNTSKKAAPSVKPAVAFASPLKADFFKSSAPSHQAIMEKQPTAVTLRFTQPVSAESSISVMHNGREYGTDAVNVDIARGTISRTLASKVPEGLYTVNYNACRADAECSSGFFQFAVLN